MKTNSVNNTVSHGLTLNRETPNNTQSLTAYIVVFDCMRTGETKTATKHARTPQHATQIVTELHGGYCEIISVTKKPIKK